MNLEIALNIPIALTHLDHVMQCSQRVHSPRLPILENTSNRVGLRANARNQLIQLIIYECASNDKQLSDSLKVNGSAAAIPGIAADRLPSRPQDSLRYQRCLDFERTGEVLRFVLLGADCVPALLFREECVDVVGWLLVGRDGRRRGGEAAAVLLDAQAHVRAELLLEAHADAHAERVARNAQQVPVRISGRESNSRARTTRCEASECTTGCVIRRPSNSLTLALNARYVSNCS